MANASSAGSRLLSGEAPQADDISRADTELTSLEEGRRPLSLDEPLRISSLRSTSTAEPTANQSDADADSARPDAVVDVVPDLPELVALTPQLLDMLRAVHVANLVKHFTHFCANSYFQPNGPLMLNARAQLKACQGAGVLPLQSLSKGEKWTVSLIEDKELKKSVLRSWEQYWASNSSAADIKRVVTKDMQKQVRGVVHGQTDFLRQICFLEEQYGSHFPNTSFPSPAHLIRGFERQQTGEQQAYTAGVSHQNLPLSLDDFNPREQAVEAVHVPSQYQAHAQALFTHISPNFTLRDVMEDVEQDDTRDLKVRDPQAQAIVVRLLCGTSKFVAEKALPHAINLLEELLARLKAESERWTEKDAWDWVESMDADGPAGEGDSQVDEWRRTASAGGPGSDDKTKVAQKLWLDSWKKIDGAREQGLVKEQQAEDHELKGEYKEAIASWTAALEADPRSEARIRFKRAHCYRACEQLPEAERDFMLLLELKDPSASLLQSQARPAVKRIRQKLKASGNAPPVAAAVSSPTSPDPTGSKAKKSKKKKKGSVDASAAIEMVEMVKEPVEELPTPPKLNAQSSPVKAPAPLSKAPATAPAPASSAKPPSEVVTANGKKESEQVGGPFDGPVVQFALASAVDDSPSKPVAPAAQPSTRASPSAPSHPATSSVPAVAPVSAVPRGLPNGSAVVESFSSAASTISSASSSVPPVASSSTSNAADTATHTPAPPRSEKRDVSLDRVPSPLSGHQQHQSDHMSMAPQGRMLVDRHQQQQQQQQTQQNQHQHQHQQHLQHQHQQQLQQQNQQHQQQQQQWREPVGFYPPPFPQHHNPYPMYHPHHPPPPHQHPNGFPMYRQEPPQELSFASLASPGPYYHGGPPPQHFQGIMPPFYHAPAPPPPPPPQPVFRDASFSSPRIVPPRPIQIQKPPPPAAPAPAPVQEVKPTPAPAPSPPLPSIVQSLSRTPAVSEPTAEPKLAPPPAPSSEKAQAEEKTAQATPAPDAPTPTPVEAAAAAPAPREKQLPVPMEFEDGIILFVCADWAASGSCPDSDCPDLHELGLEVDFNDPHDHYASYPTVDDSVPAPTLIAPASAESSEQKVNGDDAAAATAVEAEPEDKPVPAVLVTPAPTPAAQEAAAPASSPIAAAATASAPTESSPAAPAAINGASAASPTSSPPSPAPTAPLESAPAPSPSSATAAAAPAKAKKAAPSTDRWWEKGANAPSAATKEDDWATAGKKAKKPLK